MHDKCVYVAYINVTFTFAYEISHKRKRKIQYPITKKETILYTRLLYN